MKRKIDSSESGDYKHLVSSSGFSFIAIEGDWPDYYNVNRYVKGLAESGRRLKYFFRWIFNTIPEKSSNLNEWKTPDFVNIKKKRTKRISPHSGRNMG